MSTGGKIAIGCSAVALVAVVAGFIIIQIFIGKAKDFAQDFIDDPARGMATMAENIIRLNPDFESVKRDDDERSLTVRNVKTGETHTWKYDDILEGRIAITDDQGRTFQIGVIDLSQVPDWVPRYPRTVTDMAGAIEQNKGSLQFLTSDSPEEITSYFEDEAKKLGMQEDQARRADIAFPGHYHKIKYYTTPDGNRTLFIGLWSADDDHSMVSVNYEEKD